MKKLKYILIIFLMLIYVDNTLAFTNTKVYDYAQELTSKEELKLKQNIDLFIANHNMDMVLVLVKHHDKESTLSYADEFYNTKGFGVGTNKDGIMCVIDFSSDKTNIEFSKYGNAGNIYNDANINKILESVNKKEDKGYYKMLDTFIDKSSYYAKVGSNTNTISYKIVRILKLLIVSFIISIIFVLYWLLKSKLIKKKSTYKSYLVKDSFIVNKKTEKFITTKTTSINLKK